MTLGRAQSYPLFFTRLRATMTIPILFSPSRVLFRFSPPCNLSCRCWTPPFLFCSYRLLPLMLFQLNFQLLICLRLTIAIVQNQGKKRAPRSGLGEINKSKQKRRGGSEGKQREGVRGGFFDKWLFIGTGQSREGTGDISDLRTLRRIMEEITCFKFDKKYGNCPNKRSLGNISF